MKQYGIIARKEGLFMIMFPSDFDLQMMSNEEYDKLLNETSIRLDGVTSKMIINLIDEAGDFLMNKDYRVIVKIQPHEAKILLDNKYNMIAQFQGENRRQAIVNHFSLDIEEEENFFKYMEAMGYSINSPDEALENLHLMWYEDRYKVCCKTCGCVLSTRNQQDVGYCLPCYALMMSDED